MSKNKTIGTLTIKIDTKLSTEDFRSWADNHVEKMKNDIAVLGYCVEQYETTLDDDVFL